MNPYFFLEAFFTGFALYSLAWFILKKITYFNSKKEFHTMDEAAITTVGLAGLLYLGFWIFQVTGIFLGPDSDAKSSLHNRMFGRYAFGYWLPPLFYIVSSQLLWIKNIRKRSVLRLILGFMLFFDFEKFVIMVISLHRDYLPSSWTMYGGYSVFGWIIADWVLKIIIFSSFATVVYYLKNRKTL